MIGQWSPSLSFTFDSLRSVREKDGGWRQMQWNDMVVVLWLPNSSIGTGIWHTLTHRVLSLDNASILVELRMHMIYSGPIDHVCHLNLQIRESVDDLMLVTLSLPYMNFSLAKFMSFMTVHDESTMLWSCQVDQYCRFVVHYLT